MLVNWDLGGRKRRRVGWPQRPPAARVAPNRV